MSRYKAYSEYKKSRVEWICEMPSHWNLTRVKKVADVVNGYPFDARKFDPTNGVPLVRIRDIFSTSTEIKFDGAAPPNALINNGDILIGMDGDFNVATWAGGTAALNQRVACVRSSNSKVTRYLYYVLPFRMSVVNDLTYFTTVKHLSSVDISKTNFALPPHNELESIVAFLDHETAKIDALIEKQQRLIELLKEKRQAVISHAVTKGLNPNAPMKDSGVEWLGEVPEHWRIYKLKRIIKSLESGVSVNAADTPALESELGVLKTSCVYTRSFRVEENKTVLKEEYPRLKCPIRKGAIIISRMNTPELVGASAVVEVDQENIFLPDRLWQTIFSDHIELNPQFLGFYMTHHGFRNQISLAAEGASSSMQNIAKDDYLSIHAVLPGIAEQNLIVGFLDQAIENLKLLEDKARTAIELMQERRTALISAAVTGKIDVRDWQPGTAQAGVGIEC